MLMDIRSIWIYILGCFRVCTVVQLNLDILFIKSCISGNLVPTFAKVNSSIVENDVNLSKKITRLILGTELTNKHREKKTIYTEILRIQSKLKSTLSDLTYLALMYKLGKLSKEKYQQIQTRQTKKPSKLRQFWSRFQYCQRKTRTS